MENKDLDAVSVFDGGAQDTDRPVSGTAVIERIGWEHREETPEHRAGRAFTATLVFSDGPPDLPMSTVWEKRPVRLVLATSSPIVG